MYRNCVYENKSRQIHLFTWDENGRRVTQKWDYKPYLMLEDKNGEHKSIYGTSLRKKDFNSSYDRNKFVEECGLKRIFENLPPYQQFLIDNFWHSCEDEDFSKHPLKVCFLDIECPGDANSGFPEPETASEVINLLTCYDSLSKKYVSFGLKSTNLKRDDLIYYHCKSEHDLLKKFINYFADDYPDVLVGWNSSGFDVPYLVNRIKFELGEEWANKLSPIGRIYEKINPNGKFGQQSKEYVIEGISCLDYLVMYQKFNMEKQESYKLDYIGETEVGFNKIEYEGSLWDLSVKDWDKYLEYNVRDIELLVALDEKLDYISLLRFLAYTGLCSLENAIKTVPCMNGAIAIKARERGECIPTFIKPVSEYRAPGGYVAEPKIGFAENIVSYDANSLYPSVMISLNLSPETKIGKVEKIGDMIHLHHVSGRTFELTPEKFGVFIKQEKAALSKSGHLFSQKKKGIVPEFLDNLYTKRKEMKAKMIEARKAGDKEAEQKFDTLQYTYKIHLNSLYGYMLNKYAPVGDEDIGTSVTLTGQAAIKKSVELYKEYLRKRVPALNEDEIEKSYLYTATDSAYFSLRWINHLGYQLKEGDKISQKFFDECDSIENYINDGMKSWAVKSLLSDDPRFIFKREGICDYGIFIAKLYYVLHMLNDEGVAVDKFKYVGVDVVKTTMPKAIKPYVKKVIEYMVMSQSLKETNAIFNEAYDEFNKLPIEDISKNSGINNYEKYAAKCKGLETVKGMPAHVKAAYHHNYLLDQLNIASKYEKIKSGDKVRTVYVKTPNKYNLTNIGFKGKYPKEFEEIFTVDKEKMFAKLFYAAIERFYDAVGWTLRKPSENLKIELDDLFGDD
jgi:DNA polymerase elongation subunit (family B)